MNEDWNANIRGIVAVPSGFGSRLIYVDLQGSKESIAGSPFLWGLQRPEKDLACTYPDLKLLEHVS